MSIDEVVGYFTYRSFLNEPVGDPNDILWGSAELLLFISDDGAITGTLAFPDGAGITQKDFMDISGTVTSRDGPTLRFVGRGREGSSISDYEYEYDCRVVLKWDSAEPAQRLSLVGTVRRNKDHGSAKAGATASFIAVKRDFVEPRAIPGVALIPEVIAMLSARVHRLRHTVWHTIRADWQSAKMMPADRERLGKLGWYISDPPFNSDGRTLNLTNGAGEDFLYMHRRMIRMVHDVYDKAGKPRPVSWQDVPASDTAQFVYREENDPSTPKRKVFSLDPAASGFMVPPPTKQFMDQVGGTAFFRFNKTSRGMTNLMANMIANLRNPRIVSQLALGAYGNLIEFTVHNWMHMRWATISRDPETGKPRVRDDYDVDSTWDQAQHDYLGDFHSSHVNPVFWKLHGWVDDCVEVWFDVHEKAHPGQVRRREVRGIPWFEKGQWVIKDNPFDWPGAGHEDHHRGYDSKNNSELETLLAVMSILKEINDRPKSVALTAMPEVRRLNGFARFDSVVAVGIRPQ